MAALNGWRRGAAAFAAGAFSVLAMAPFFAAPVLFITLPVLVWLLDGCANQPRGARGRAEGSFRSQPVWLAAVTGWLFGFGYFLAGLYWIGAAFLVEAERFAWLLPFAVSMLPAGLALYFAAATAFAFMAWRPGPTRLVSLALAFMASEWLRGHLLSGFPWNTLGYALTSSDVLMQSSALVGIYGLTPIAVLIFAAPATLWAPPWMAAKTWPVRMAIPLTGVVLLAVAATWGVLRLGSGAPDYVGDVQLRIVQPNIPQAEKWKPENRAQVFHTLMRLSAGQSGEADASGLSSVTHVIWPESSVPFLLADTGAALRAIAELLPLGTSLIVGAARGETVDTADGGARQRRIYNSVFVIDHNGRIMETYDKIRLVPFGEFLPLQGVLETIGLEQLTRLRGGFAVGERHVPLHVDGAPPFSPLICYEIIFPHWVRGDEGSPGWLLNVTNDAWFGITSGPYQHFHQARVRAVEQGLAAVRAANSGISAVIDPYGRIIGQLSLDERGALDAPLPRAISSPPFAMWGRAIELMVLAIFTLAWLGLAAAEERGKKSS